MKVDLDTLSVQASNLSGAKAVDASSAWTMVPLKPKELTPQVAVQVQGNPCVGRAKCASLELNNSSTKGFRQRNFVFPAVTAISSTWRARSRPI